MIISTALLMRERGARATSIDDVLAHSGAARGSVYHHFPGGRDELLREATAYAGEYVARRLERVASDPDPLAAFDVFLAGYREQLLAGDLRDGCPLVAVAIEHRQDGDRALQDLAGRVFERWQALLAKAFIAAGIPEARAPGLATMAISGLEGALVLARAQHSVEPLDRVREQLRALLQAERR
ncbi:MAG TPA: TetR/AcrR family transcriptional regulator [Solirubrobacteraceae bacterium]|jgi:AcrR family transcriptional regulator|nr:TetR/AcrR family transcriptional regulator [Solirubrobacteraceae bacterium]